uniref:Glucosylceramidase n=1 Tax=Meloidogyne incognita TaxID=6306 RepID=A0A914P4G1_MELIC
MMKPLFISQGRYEFNANIFMDQIPRRITLGLVSNSDYVGDIKRSPFNFSSFLMFARLVLLPMEEIIHKPLGLVNSTESNGITLQQYGKTHCIYVFNLTNSGEDQGGTFDLIKNGTTAVNIKFSKPVPEGGIMLIVMGEADSLIMLDKNRTIASDTTI